ncbi:uncharacterized protein [Anabrus simplex]|uniref:uncharacterized protein n=1 Tax=Anabrus simplex TaxID=316456 RepID=UPI0035A29012
MFLTIACLSLLGFSRASEDSLLGGLKFNLEDYYPCGEEAYIMEYSDINVGRFNRSTIILNATLTYHEDVSDKFHITAELTKCDSKQQKDSCQFFYALEIKEICKNWDNPLALEHQFEESLVNMKKECPMPAGVYNVVNAMFDIKDIERTPGYCGYWYVKFIAYDGDKEIGCFIAEVNVSKKRN